MRSFIEKSLNLDYVKLSTKWWTAVFIFEIHQFSLNDCWSELLWHMFYIFFILRLRLRPTAKGRSFSGPNIRLRPKVKIAPTVQHWKSEQRKVSLICYLHFFSNMWRVQLHNIFTFYHDCSFLCHSLLTSFITSVP